VRSLLAIDYPSDGFRIVVVADNCSDQTAERATEAGATVLERTDPERRGKGHALAFAFERLIEQGITDAFVVVDADTVVSPNLLEAFASRIEMGAVALQADYGVRNPDDSWRTRLLHLAFTLFHEVRSSGRERLGLSCGLRGNGMAFTSAVLTEVPHNAFSVVEDVEYGIRLGLAGHRVQYVGEAQVLGEMPATERASRSQRARWEEGRRTLARRHSIELLKQATRRRSLVLLDLALDLLVPPLSILALVTSAGLVVSMGGWLAGLGTSTAAAAWAAAAAGLAVYVARGWLAAGLGWQGLFDLARFPGYVLWKLAVRARRDPSRRGVWVRTQRNGDSPADGSGGTDASPDSLTGAGGRSVTRRS
jgi:GT2 family glycosyltransferase